MARCIQPQAQPQPGARGFTLWREKLTRPLSGSADQGQLDAVDHSSTVLRMLVLG